MAGDSAFLEYCCPKCKGSLRSFAERYYCEACDHEYPIVLGIPDFRVFADPYISYEEDRKKGLRIAARYHETDYRGLVDYYWSITEETSDEMRKHYVQYAITGRERGEHFLNTIESARPDLKTSRNTRMLEVGCRTGGFLAAAAERFEQVVGIDIAFRWLIVARKQLEEQNRAAQLVCCCAQYLPFAPAEFDLIVAENVLEHTRQQQALLDEAHRALKPGGTFFALTCNRFSLGPEPHVRLMGVGWLPRRWMSAYVRLFRGTPYTNVRLLSLFELRRMVGRSPFRSGRFDLPDFCESQMRGLSALEGRLVRIYHRIKAWRVVRSVLFVVGPVLQLICVKAETKRSP